MLLSEIAIQIDVSEAHQEIMIKKKEIMTRRDSE